MAGRQVALSQASLLDVADSVGGQGRAAGKCYLSSEALGGSASWPGKDRLSELGTTRSEGHIGRDSLKTARLK